MLLRSIDGVIMNRPTEQKSNSTKTQDNSYHNPSQAFNLPANLATMNGGIFAQQSGNINAPNLFKTYQDTNQMGGLDGAVQQPTKFQTQGLQSEVSHLGLPAGATQMGILPDGAALISYGGAGWRSFLNGGQTIMEPLQVQTPFFPSVNYSTDPYTQMTIGAQIFSPFNTYPTAQHHGGNEVFGSSLCYPDTRLHQPDAINRSDDDSCLHDLWSSQLTNVDKHLALHGRELPQKEHETLVALRKQLVQGLDNLRLSKDNKTVSNSASLLAFASQGQSGWAMHQDTKEGPGTPFGMPLGERDGENSPTAPITAKKTCFQPAGQGANNRPQVPQTPTNRYLSPDAPPFIPSSNGKAMTNQTDKGRLWNTIVPQARRHGSDQINDSSSLLVQAQIDLGKTRRSSRTSFMPVSNKEPAPSTKLNSNTPRKGTRNVSSSELSAPEPIPIVYEDEARYADERHVNPIGEPKRYCSTVAEFQEVIRQVREQARLHGCAGGQSKDPEYDAEQDIRWAMADYDPIPLPGLTVDHIQNPRPWSWHDSVFNVRRMDNIYGEEGIGPCAWDAEDSTSAKDSSLPVRAAHGRSNGTGAYGNDPKATATSLTANTLSNTTLSPSVDLQAKPAEAGCSNGTRLQVHGEKRLTNNWGSNSTSVEATPRSRQRSVEFAPQTPARSVQLDKARLDQAQRGYSTGQQRFHSPLKTSTPPKYKPHDPFASPNWGSPKNSRGRSSGDMASTQ